MRAAGPRAPRGTVVLIRLTRHGGTAVAGNPDGTSIDAGLQLAAVALLRDEGVESSARRFKVFLSHATAVLPPRPLMMRFRPSP